MTGPLVIRADADSTIGAGHVMRSIALAQAWIRRGGTAILAGRLGNPALEQRLRNEFIQFRDLSGCSSFSEEIEVVLAATGDRRFVRPWFVLDGYHFDCSYQQTLRAAGAGLVVVDDYCHLPEYSADILLNQNLNAEALKYSVSGSVRMLLGLKYCLLRKEFLEYEHADDMEESTACNILVTMGGADPDNVTSKVLKGVFRFADETESELNIKVVAGPLNPNIGNILQVAESGTECEVLSSVSDMPALLDWADAAISAGGSTCWELAFFQVPFAAVVLADNQEGLVEGLNEAGAAISLGRGTNLTTNAVVRVLKRLMTNQEERRLQVFDRDRLVDGLGADRVCTVIEEFMGFCSEDRCDSGDGLFFRLREVGPQDCGWIGGLTNEPGVRAASFSSGAVSARDHRKWFKTRLDDPATLMYVAEDGNGEPLGQVRFQVESDKAVISVSVVPEARGGGFGSLLIRKGAARCFVETAVDVIEAFIKKDNPASIRAFEKAGFLRRGETEIKGTPAVSAVLERNRKEMERNI